MVTLRIRTRGGTRGPGGSALLLILDLLAGIVELLRPFVQIASLSNDALTQLLLYGDQDLSNDLNKNILELTLRFIHKTGRFD